MFFVTVAVCEFVLTRCVCCKVGDGLEIYIVFAKGRSVQGLQEVRGLIQEVSATEGGERVFVIRRELKKD